MEDAGSFSTLREWFLIQMRNLSRAKVQWSGYRVITMPTDSDLEYAWFGMTLGQIGAQSWLEPVSGARGMMRPPGMKAEKLDFDPCSTRSSEFGK